MAENREIILDAIETALAGITVAGGYRTTIETVSRELLDFDRVRGTTPWIGYAPSEQQRPPEYTYGGRHEYLRVRIVAHLEARAQADRTAAISDIDADIEDAMTEDPTWGGYAVDTLRVAPVLSEEGLPDKGGTTAGITSCVLEYEIDWYV